MSRVMKIVGKTQIATWQLQAPQVAFTSPTRHFGWRLTSKLPLLTATAFWVAERKVEKPAISLHLQFCTCAQSRQQQQQNNNNVQQDQAAARATE
ncbi:unnamed protein product [Ceratitis capitata]|uniref:(Mediterranean fruit fly) hypothetical protein n=1 Tax=Ceratitis capitata TaxID=7213 RepID=A0A811V4L5_CERCA|nr:unnamed protein product [Ceratitis capitata]